MINKESIIIQAKAAFELNMPEKALALLQGHPAENSGAVLFLKGEIYFKLEKWGEALNHFSLFLEHFPSDKKAESYCLMIKNILAFHHKDLYNP